MHQECFSTQSSVKTHGEVAGDLPTRLLLLHLRSQDSIFPPEEKNAAQKWSKPPRREKRRPYEDLELFKND